INRRNTPRVSFIGFGEAGQAIAAGLRETGIERIAAWDILFPEPGGARLKAAGETIGVRLANSAADAVAETAMIISAVTAASRLGAARSAPRRRPPRPQAGARQALGLARPLGGRRGDRADNPGAPPHALADRRPARRGDFAATARIADAAVDRGRQ